MGAWRNLASQHSFQITDGLDRGKAGFREIDLITIFERTHQGDAIQGA